MAKSERIAYMCGGKFIYQGDMVLVQLEGYDFMREHGLESGVLLGLSSILNNEPHNHLRVLINGQVHCVLGRHVFPNV